MSQEEERKAFGRETRFPRWPVNWLVKCVGSRKSNPIVECRAFFAKYNTSAKVACSVSWKITSTPALIKWRESIVAWKCVSKRGMLIAWLATPSLCALSSSKDNVSARILSVKYFRVLSLSCLFFTLGEWFVDFQKNMSDCTLNSRAMGAFLLQKNKK